MSDTSVATGSIGAAVSVATFLLIYVLRPMFNAANHKRIRSICCGRTCVTSLDIEDTTPTVKVENPASSIGRITVSTLPPTTPRTIP